MTTLTPEFQHGLFTYFVSLMTLSACYVCDVLFVDFTFSVECNVQFLGGYS